MLFVELEFFVFLAVVFALYWGALHDIQSRKYLLLVASYVFYASWDWRFCGLIAFSTVVDHLVALRIGASEDPRRRRHLLWVSLGANLGMLGIFKYAGFFLDSFQDSTNALGVPVSDLTLQLTLPVGISFYTFQTLSYTFDVYRGRLQPRRSILDTATFVAFFPQLVAGPIVRAKFFLGQLDRQHRLADVQWRAALGLIAVGFVKKGVVADTLAFEVDRLYDAPLAHSTIGAALGVLMYAAQIYGDFSGYTDMAIGTAMLFGYSLGKNFDFPYLATSLTDFWRRWHISLSNWLRDYVLLALPGKDETGWRYRRNIMITMLLGGLWHGAAWTFVVWGGLNGVWLVAEHTYRARHRRRVPDHPGTEIGAIDGAGRPLATLSRQRVERRRRSGLLDRLPQRVATFGGVCLLLVLFRAPTFGHARAVFRKLVSFDLTGAHAPRESIGLLGVAAVLHLATWSGARRRWLDPRPDWMFVAGLGVLTALAVALLPVDSRPFVYFQF